LLHVFFVDGSILRMREFSSFVLNPVGIFIY
jgi:hypothetical protein